MPIYRQDTAQGAEVWMFPGDYTAIGGPAFDFNFSGLPKLDPRIAFTSTSGGAYVDGEGAAQVAAANQPRFNFDASTKICKGLLIASANSESAIITDLSTIGGIGSAMTLYAEFYAPTLGGAGFPGVVSLDDGTNANAIAISIFDATSDRPTLEVYSGGVAQAAINNGNAVTSGQLCKVAASWSTDSFRFAFNGVAATEDTSGTLPTVNRLVFGQARGGGNYLGSELRRVTGWRGKQMTSAQLATLTL